MPLQPSRQPEVRDEVRGVRDEEDLAMAIGPLVEDMHEHQDVLEVGPLGFHPEEPSLDFLDLPEDSLRLPREHGRDVPPRGPCHDGW